jgi:hypothetical protein
MKHEKNRKRLPLFLLAFLMASTCFGQIIINGGFESGQLGPWFQGGNFTSITENPENWNVISTDAHSGLYAATDVGNIELRQNFAPVPTSMIQDVSLWLRQPFGPSLSAVYFHYSSSPDQFIRLDTHDTGWDFFDITSSLTPNKSLTGISIFGYSGGSTARTLIDDVSLTLAPEPATVPLFGLSAAIAILWRLRRRQHSFADS